MPDKDSAAEFCRNRQDDMRIFTDGSGLEGGIGAASILYSRKGTQVSHFYLGQSTDHTVFEGEISGVILATHQAQKFKLHNPQSILIALDNQSAIRSLAANRQQPSQYLLDEAIRGIESIKKKWPNVRICIAWAPGHHGLVENEAVDEEAKRAANGHSSTSIPRFFRHRLPASISARKAQVSINLREKWLNEWKTTPRYQKFSRIDPWSTPNQINRTLSRLTRQKSSLLTQLRTGHSPLNVHLVRCKRVESSLCPRCHMACEDLQHILLLCPRYQTARNLLLSRVKYAVFSVRRLMSEPKSIPHTLRFLQDTHRFSHYFQ